MTLLKACLQFPRDAQVGTGAVRRLFLAVHPRAGVPLHDLVEHPLRPTHMRPDGRGHRRIVVRGLADRERLPEAAAGQHRVRITQGVSGAGGIVVEVDLEPVRQRAAPGLDQVDESAEPIAPIAGVARGDGRHGHVPVSERGGIGRPHLSYVRRQPVAAGVGKVAARGALVEQVEAHLGGAMLQRERTNRTNEVPVLFEQAVVVVVAHGAVPPLRAEREGEPREPEAPHLVEEGHEVAAVGLREPTPARWNHAPVLPSDVTHVPDDEPQRLNALGAHLPQLVVDQFGRARVTVRVENAEVGTLAVQERPVRVVRAHDGGRIWQRGGRRVVLVRKVRQGRRTQRQVRTDGQHDTREGPDQQAPTHANGWHGECTSAGRNDIDETITCNNRAVVGGTR